MHTKPRFLYTALTFSITCAALGNTVVVPNSQANASGNFPISVSGSGVRFQETLGGGQFPGPITIVGFHLRSTAGAGAFSYSATSLKITVSTTQSYPNTVNGHALPSATYASNVGPDAVVAFNGPFSTSSPGCAAPGPCPFDMFVPFSSPFAFDPTKGRLLIDIVANGQSGTGSWDGVSFTDSTQSTVAFVSGDAAAASGTVVLGGLVFAIEADTPCNGNNNPPCTVAGTLIANSASGPLFGDAGGTITNTTTGHETTIIVNDLQSPGVSFGGDSGFLLRSAGAGAQVSLSGTLNLATLSGAPAITGGAASITCGVTGNATASMTVSTGSGNTTLTCPKTGAPGIVTQVAGRISLSPVKSIVENITITASAPGSGDTFSISGYSTQALLGSSAPSIITDTGVINGGNYEPGKVVSGSWVAIKGSGFTDPGVTVDWSKSDFSNGLPAILNGVQVLFNGQPGAVWYLIDGPVQQINAQAPANLSGPITVQVVRNKVASNIVTTTAVQSSPGIFSYTLDGGTTFYPAAVFIDRTPLGDPALYPGSRKAKAGDVVVIFANSLAPSPAGVVSVSGSTKPVTVTIGSTSFQADFSGLVAPGEFQINFTVPQLPSGGNLPFTITIDGQPSQTGVVFPYSN